MRNTVILAIIVFIITFMPTFECAAFNTVAQDMKIISECNTSYPVSKDDLNHSLIELRFEKGVDRNFKCFLHCLHVSYGWISQNGTFNNGNITDVLQQAEMPIELAELLVNLCTLVNEESDPCERSFQFIQCFWMEAKRQDPLPEPDEFFNIS